MICGYFNFASLKGLFTFSWYCSFTIVCDFDAFTWYPNFPPSFSNKYHYFFNFLTSLDNLGLQQKLFVEMVAVLYFHETIFSSMKAVIDS